MVEVSLVPRPLSGLGTRLPVGGGKTARLEVHPIRFPDYNIAALEGLTSLVP